MLFTTGACLCIALVLRADSPIPSSSAPLRLRPEPTVLNPIEAELFGQFMERASWGEPGYDAARDPKRPDALRPRIVEMLDELHIPVMRFPGGTDMRDIDWRDMIDHLPGRPKPLARPDFSPDNGARTPGDRIYTNAFGIDEFLHLCRDLGSEPLLVTNFYQAYVGKVPQAEGTRLAAGLVAYCNLPVGSELPTGMPDWPSVRARNGQPEPFGVRYFQIGNEEFQNWDEALEQRGIAKDAPVEEKCRPFIETTLAFARAMRAIDPSILLIMEGCPTWTLPERRHILANEELKKAIDFASVHFYMPWAMRDLERDGQPVTGEQLDAEEVWKAWTAGPGNDADGRSVLDGDHAINFRLAADEGWAVACTEWNWNGGWWKRGPGILPEDAEPPLDSHLARGLGAAGFLHAMMREGGTIRLATQSMVVGTRWDINAIRVSEDGSFAPYFHPSGQVTGLYSRHHGNRRIALHATPLPGYQQPLKMGGLRPEVHVAYLDPLATMDDDTLYIHVINRDLRDIRAVLIDTSAFQLDGDRNPRLHSLTGRVRNQYVGSQGIEVSPGSPAQVYLTELPEANNSSPLLVDLPPRSVSVIEIPLKPRQP